MRKKIYLYKYKFVIMHRDKITKESNPVLGGFIISKHKKRHVEDVFQGLCGGLALFHPAADYGYILEDPETHDVTGTPTEFTVKSMTC